MTRTKIQNIGIEKELLRLKNTYPNLKLINHLELGRLTSPDLFVYPNKNRLYREVTDKIIQSMLDFCYAIDRLPQSYKEEIVISTEFSAMMNHVFSAGQIEKLKKEDQYPKVANENSDDNTIQTDLYLKFFNIGLEGLIRTLPSTFSPYLQSQMKPLLLLMLAISQTTKTKHPIHLDFPSWIHDPIQSVLH